MSGPNSNRSADCRGNRRDDCDRAPMEGAGCRAAPQDLGAEGAREGLRNLSARARQEAEDTLRAAGRPPLESWNDDTGVHEQRLLANREELREILKSYAEE